MTIGIGGVSAVSNLRKNVILPSLGNVSVNFYDAAASIAELYQRTNEFERQKGVSHLGLISSEIEGASHSRYEYVMLQCALTDVLDKLHKGSVAQGSLKVDGKSYLGNGLLKAWFLLSNFGHLKNTMGDEKALIQFALKRKGFRRQLLRPIRSATLQNWCDTSISNFEYPNFHYVVSAYRVYKDQPRHIEAQDEAAKLIELLLVGLNDLPYRVDKAKLLQLRSLFKKIRDIAIVTIDGHHSHSPLSIDLISCLVSFDEIEGG